MNELLAGFRQAFTDAWAFRWVAAAAFIAASLWQVWAG
jgi:hypothetical protein